MPNAAAFATLPVVSPCVPAIPPVLWAYQGTLGNLQRQPDIGLRGCPSAHLSQGKACGKTSSGPTTASSSLLYPRYVLEADSTVCPRAMAVVKHGPRLGCSNCVTYLPTCPSTYLLPRELYSIDTTES
ncbi:hypothetical protein IF2G_00807 [Cordyceps javanica]|nr:hypothetical protein IF2G_00807 [Cordyceps javanica]